jgi:hypothetical protein
LEGSLVFSQTGAEYGLRSTMAVLFNK